MPTITIYLNAVKNLVWTNKIKEAKAFAFLKSDSGFLPTTVYGSQSIARDEPKTQHEIRPENYSMCLPQPKTFDLKWIVKDQLSYT